MGSSKKVILQLDKEMKWVGTCGDGATGGMRLNLELNRLLSPLPFDTNTDPS